MLTYLRRFLLGDSMTDGWAMTRRWRRLEDGDEEPSRRCGDGGEILAVPRSYCEMARSDGKVTRAQYGRTKVAEGVAAGRKTSGLEPESCATTGGRAFPGDSLCGTKANVPTMWLRVLCFRYDHRDAMNPRSANPNRGTLLATYSHDPSSRTRKRSSGV